ncbi:hypothetical protein CLV40_103253 [Actinokineospora auranticolor]|uniref:Uncharacterized protein n=1 Tax=Actinokineospora auranticolor TaxID=155976 RepID=A0A2S6GWR1_9PSEU|nr:hypothetical protein CLV40_103253 [Actinokineospora auranticolor]
MSGASPARPQPFAQVTALREPTVINGITHTRVSVLTHHGEVAILRSRTETTATRPDPDDQDVSDASPRSVSPPPTNPPRVHSPLRVTCADVSLLRLTPGRTAPVRPKRARRPPALKQARPTPVTPEWRAGHTQTSLSPASNLSVGLTCPPAPPVRPISGPLCPTSSVLAALSGAARLSAPEPLCLRRAALPRPFPAPPRPSPARLRPRLAASRSVSFCPFCPSTSSHPACPTWLFRLVRLAPSFPCPLLGPLCLLASRCSASPRPVSPRPFSACRSPPRRPTSVRRRTRVSHHFTASPLPRRLVSFGTL